MVGTGRARYYWTLVVAIVAIAGLCRPAAAADRVALVIGNGKYVNANALPNPPNDARAIANKLSDTGFDVAFGQDLDRAGMERLVRDFLHKAVPAKVALLYYAGHGLQVDGRNYLVPIDAKLEAPSDLNYETVKLDDILDNLNDPGRANIIILDACRDNPLARSFAARLGASRSTAVATGLAGYSTLGTGTLIAFSTAPGQVALDGDGVNSPFTQALVKHLAEPGLEVRQMLTRVRDDVARATRDRQVPWDNSSLRGDVYLADASKAVAEGSVPTNAAKLGAEVGGIADTVRAATPPSPVPSANNPGADEIAWDFVKNTRDPGELRRFIEQYPKSAHLVEAATKLAALAAQPNVDSDTRDISKRLQIELRRVGCLSADTNGDWNASSVRALELFNRYRGSSFDTKLASLDALEAVRGVPSRICPTVCDRGYHAEGEGCVADKLSVPERIRERLQEHQLRVQQRERWRESPEGQSNPRAGGTIGCPPSVMPCQ